MTQDHTGGLLKRAGRARTDMSCTECGKNFVAMFDHDIDGNHIVECPWCAHEHCRVIKGGMVTGDRWETRKQRVDVPARHVWKNENDTGATSTASLFIRDRWLNKDLD
jgi:hypothetical protein